MRCILLTPLKVRVCFKPLQTLRDHMLRPKDPIPDLQKSRLVYKIPCGHCSASYVGQTSRRLCQQLEHKRAIWLANFNSSALTKHVWSKEHPVDWSGVIVLSNASDTHTRLTQEAIFIRTIENTLNPFTGKAAILHHTSHGIDWMGKGAFLHHQQMAIYINSLDQKVYTNDEFTSYSWSLGPILTLNQVTKLYCLPLCQTITVWGPHSTAILQIPFTHMALCTFAITVDHDLKPHRGKGRPIETLNRKGCLWISLCCLVLVVCWMSKLAKTPTQWVWHM